MTIHLPIFPQTAAVTFFGIIFTAADPDAHFETMPGRAS